MKKYCLVVGLLLLLSLQMGMAHGSSNWKKAFVVRVLDNQHVLLSDDRVVRLIGIQAPDRFAPRPSEQCLTRPIWRALRELLEQKPIRLRTDKAVAQTGSTLPAHIKLPDGTSLAEWLLHKGWARLEADVDHSYVKKYHTAQNQAQSQHRGIWGQCSTSPLRARLRANGHLGPEFRERYAQYLAPISVGRVSRVLSGQHFELENGLVIRLLGIETPSPQDERTAYACFGTQAKDYLTSLIADQKVFLKQDISQFNSDGQLLRYVSLKPTNKRGREEVFVGEAMISAGYARSAWAEPDTYFRDRFDQLEAEQWQSPRGAWTECLGDMMVSEQEKENVEYDPDCPIKGNISGTKSNPVRTYHTPKSQWYKNLKYEECFETEEIALKAGFRKIR